MADPISMISIDTQPQVSTLNLQHYLIIVTPSGGLIKFLHFIGPQMHANWNEVKSTLHLF